MAKTTKARSHKNNEARTIATERAVSTFSRWYRGSPMIMGDYDKDTLIGVISRALQSHARATLERAKRRAQ